MSSSDPNSKIDFLDSPEAVRKKIKLAFCEEGNIAENGILAFVQVVLIPISQMRLERRKGETTAERDESASAFGDQSPFVTEDAPDGTVFTIERDAKFGGPTHYRSFEDMQRDFAEKTLHPKDLKASVAGAINRLLDPIRKGFEGSEEWQRVEKLAYPDPNAKPEKKKKKEKAYHPPPPGKGKQDPSRVVLAEPSHPVVTASAPIDGIADQEGG
jgi:tyrosyl-tRNA synthetase